MILVTGGAGFIGSNLIAGLEARGHRGIVVCDRMGGGAKWRNLARHPIGTILSPERLTGFLDEAGPAIEAIFHIGLDAGLADVDGLLAANYHAAAELWAWCAQNEVRFIYASTAETYGAGAAGFDDDIDEAALAALCPTTPRGWTKHLFDRAVARTVAAGSPCPPQWAGLKLFDVYGPNEYHKDGGASLPLTLWDAAAGTDIPLCGDPMIARDWVWVGDCIAAMLWIYETGDVSGLFNIATGTSRPIGEVAEAFVAATGKTVSIESAATPSQALRRYHCPNRAPIDRLRAAGYAAPFLSIEEGLARYTGEYLSRDDPYL